MPAGKKDPSVRVKHHQRRANSGKFIISIGYAGMAGKIEDGLSTSTLDSIATRMGVDLETIRRLAKISSTTLVRRRHKGRFSAEESDRLHRLQRITERTIEFFDGNAPAARRWLERPAKALGGARPLDLLINDAGVQEVDALLGRLDHGVFL